MIRAKDVLRVGAKSILYYGAFFSCLEAGALWMTPDETVPLERLVENTKRYISSHPEDASAYAMLGRAYSLAFALDVKSFDFYNAQEEGGHPELIVRDFQERPDRSWNRPGDLSPEKQELMMTSIRYYQKAVKLAPKASHFWLGLGYMYHEGSREVLSLMWPFPGEDFDQEVLDAVKNEWVEKALAAYENALEYSGTLPETIPSGVDASGFLGAQLETYDGIIELLSEQTSLDRSKVRTLEKYRKLRVEFQEKYNGHIRRMWITPIIFSLEKSMPLHELLSEDTVVRFDLAGDNVQRNWPWVAPNTGLLVWDLKDTGSITSGRQLIGSRTWWLFWETGYQVLASLDDDGDGWLTGEELTGLAVWTDRNSNGVSDDGEVVGLQHTEIEALSIRATAMSGHSPWNPEGIRLRGGQGLPTYDWTTKSLGAVTND